MDNAIDELIAECGEILADPDSYNLVSEAKRIESALETVVPKVRVGLKMFRASPAIRHTGEGMPPRI
jgi:hypothetical protein